MSSLGCFIKHIREERNLTLRDFAKLTNLSHSYINKLEKGIDPRNNKPVIPTIDTLYKISTALNYSLIEFLSAAGYVDHFNNNLGDGKKFILDLLEMIYNKCNDEKIKVEIIKARYKILIEAKKANELEDEFPEGVEVLRRATKKLSPEDRKKLVQIMKAFIGEEG